MTTVWKYAIPFGDFQDVVILEMPKGSQVLSVTNQYESLTIYAEVDPAEKEKEQKLFRVAGTGHPIMIEHTGRGMAYRRFLGTVLFMDGELAFHVWEFQ